MNLCQCGCGKPAPIAKQNHAKYGWIKGQPMKYIHGHTMNGKFREDHPKWKNGTVISGKYIFILMPEHPKANSNGYVKRSRLIAEKVLGKYLPQHAVIHHANEDKKDDANHNITICEDKAYHNLLHQRKRAYDICGYANWRKCKYCKQYDNPKNLIIDSENRAYHQKCKNIYQNTRYKLRENNEKKSRRAIN